MPIKLDCPRCNRPLSVPSKKIGRYANCPRCGGRFWVPENAAADLPEVDPDRLPAGSADSAAGTEAEQPPPWPDELPSTISMGGAATSPPSGVVPGPPAGQNTPARHQSGPPPSPPEGGSHWQIVPPPVPDASPAPQPPRPCGGASISPTDGTGPKTARFISADAVQSTLELAEDGMLPELHLQEGVQKEKKEAKTTTVNPLVLFGLLAISVACSIGLVLLDVSPAENQRKEEAREVIRTEFFSLLDDDRPLQPYQLELRAAQRAHTQGDRQRERELYQKVLNRLRQEPAAGPRENSNTWLTGSRDRDKRLKKQISILLSTD